MPSTGVWTEWQPWMRNILRGRGGGISRFPRPLGRIVINKGTGNWRVNFPVRAVQFVNGVLDSVPETRLCESVGP